MRTTRHCNSLLYFLHKSITSLKKWYKPWSSNVTEPSGCERRNFTAIERLSSSSYIVSGWRGMIKSKSIIPHFPTDHSPRTTPHHSGCTGTSESRSIIPHSPTDDGRLPTDHYAGVTGIDMRLKCSLVYRNRTSDIGSVKGGRIGSRNLTLFLLSQSRKNSTGRGIWCSL